jgi:CheY-like chemotaxis protein
MARILLVLWHEAENADRAASLEALGYEIARFWEQRNGPALRGYRENPPDGVVIDLTRLPSQGCAVAVALRGMKATRRVPLVFIAGDTEKTQRVRALIPDAIYTTWSRIDAALDRALRQPRLAEPAVPGTFAGYSGTPLAAKLRIREATTACLLDAPDGFEARLEPLPSGARVMRGACEAAVLLAFARSAADLASKLPMLRRQMREGRTLWLIWPKKTSALASDLGEKQVRAMGLAAGLVDFKICAVDEVWSGLAFGLRKPSARP